MYNNSKAGLLNDINESPNNDHRSNGKARCSLCNLETSEEGEDDIFIHNYKMNKLSKIVKGDKNSVITISKQSQYITPCKCDWITHSLCIRKYIIKNLSLRCNKCMECFNLDYQYKPISFLKVFYALLIAIMHILFFVVSILEIIMNDNVIYEFWGYIIIGVGCGLNILLMQFSYVYIVSSFRRHEINIIVSNYKGGNITRSQIKKFCNFLKNKYHCKEEELIELKSQLLYSLNRDKIKLKNIIKENNILFENRKNDKPKAHINISVHSYLKKAQDIKFENKLNNLKLNMFDEKPEREEKKIAFDPYMINTIQEKDSEHYEKDIPCSPNSRSVIFDKNTFSKKMTTFKPNDNKAGSKFNTNFEGIIEENSI
jgi:hypothetical protein